MTEQYVPSVYIPPTGIKVPQLDPKTIAVGDEVPPLPRHGDYQLWNRYAAVNYEFAGHHMDDAVGHHEGFETAIGMGPFIYALFHTLLRQWIGEDTGRIVRVEMQSRRPWLRGRMLTEAGKVTTLKEEDGELLVSLDIWAEDDRGERMAIGTAEVAVQL